MTSTPFSGVITTASMKRRRSSRGRSTWIVSRQPGHGLFHRPASCADPRLCSSNRRSSVGRAST